MWIGLLLGMSLLASSLLLQVLCLNWPKEARKAVFRLRRSGDRTAHPAEAQEGVAAVTGVRFAADDEESSRNPLHLQHQPYDIEEEEEEDDDDAAGDIELAPLTGTGGRVKRHTKRGERAQQWQKSATGNSGAGSARSTAATSSSTSSIRRLNGGTGSSSSHSSSRIFEATASREQHTNAIHQMFISAEEEIDELEFIEYGNNSATPPGTLNALHRTGSSKK